MSAVVENRFEIDNTAIYKKICGFNDKNIRQIEKSIEVDIIPRGNTLIVKASKDRNESAMKLLHLMSDFLVTRDTTYEFDDFDIKYLISSVKGGMDLRPEDISRLKVQVPDNGKIIVPKSLNQARYMTSIYTKPVTFGIGPAGTGKTYLAVVTAVKLFSEGRVERIILTRPAVEAGESLGFLPGDLLQKINPYLRPLYDALFELQSYEKISKLMEKGSIEIAPLAYMRGRTLNNAFIILDEAQNTTTSQMKMFLTRMGNNSKIVISGDDTQIDLERPSRSGLIHAKKILKNIKEISFIYFTKDDISRHPIVEKIVEAYDRAGHGDS